MQPSLVGLLVSAILLVFTWYMRWGLVAALLGSMAFGATSIGTLGALGGATPLIYTLFCLILLAAAVAHPHVWRQVGLLFGQFRTVWLVLALILYTGMGAILLPRLFAGQTSVFLASHTKGGVYEQPLAPSSANITQAGYFILGCLVFFAVCLLLRRGTRLRNLGQGYFLLSSLIAAFGMIDLVAKLAGAGDILMPIRTASYEMLTDVHEAGFARIVGAYPEASSFGGAALAGLAFAYGYWRETSSEYALCLGLLLLALLLLSTSSTAYAGLAIVSLPVAFSVTKSFLASRVSVQDMFIVTMSVLLLIVVMALGIFQPHVFDPVTRLFDNTVLSKMQSSSGQERMYWNTKAIQSFFDTMGLGVGIGSSRASSWPIALLSQMGLPGTLATITLVGVLARSLHDMRSRLDRESFATLAGIRSSALAGLVGAGISSGSADPGVSFFIALAAVIVTRERATNQDYRRPALEEAALPANGAATAGAAGLRPRRPAAAGGAAATLDPRPLPRQ